MKWNSDYRFPNASLTCWQVCCQFQLQQQWMHQQLPMDQHQHLLLLFHHCFLSPTHHTLCRLVQERCFQNPQGAIKNIHSFSSGVKIMGLMKQIYFSKNLILARVLNLWKVKANPRLWIFKYTCKILLLKICQKRAKKKRKKKNRQNTLLKYFQYQYLFLFCLQSTKHFVWMWPCWKKKV